VDCKRLHLQSIQPIGHANPDSDCCADAYPDCDTNSYSKRYRHSDCNCNRDADSHAESNPDSYAGTDRDSYSNGCSDCDSNANSRAGRRDTKHYSERRHILSPSRRASFLQHVRGDDLLHD
jgi:hypothetical protein